LLLDDVLMRVVAGEATDAGICAVETLAVGQSVGCEANIGGTDPVISDYRRPAAMTLAAKIGNIFRRHFAQAGRGRIEAAMKSVEQVRAGSNVAMFAAHPRLHAVQVQLAVFYGVSRMASETIAERRLIELAAEGFFQSCRLQALVADG
jgi:hypothetical protein